jgi:hypothetical protein
MAHLLRGTPTQEGIVMLVLELFGGDMSAPRLLLQQHELVMRFHGPCRRMVR